MAGLKLNAVYSKLFKELGKQYWWPVTDLNDEKPTYKERESISSAQKFEIAVGAILTQNTSWKNVLSAIENLNKEGMLSVNAIANSEKEKLALAIKSSGYYNQKAGYLQVFARHLIENYNGNSKSFFSKETNELRKELLSLKGIGFETADDILLYAAEKPVFVIDAYTKRICNRLGLFSSKDYHELQNFFHENLHSDLKLFQEFHALIVRFSQEYCLKKPVCDSCFFRKKCRFS